MYSYKLILHQQSCGFLFSIKQGLRISGGLDAFGIILRSRWDSGTASAKRHGTYLQDSFQQSSEAVP